MSPRSRSSDTRDQPCRRARFTVLTRSAGVVAVKTTKSGGLRASRAIAEVAAAAGIPCYAATSIESPVGTAAALHFACSTPAVTWGSELFGPLLMAEEMLVEPLVYDPVGHPPVGPQGATMTTAFRDAPVRTPLCYGLDEVPVDLGPSVLTIGVFDGLHRGHRRLVDPARRIADERGLPLAACPGGMRPTARSPRRPRRRRSASSTASPTRSSAR